MSFRITKSRLQPHPSRANYHAVLKNLDVPSIKIMLLWYFALEVHITLGFPIFLAWFCLYLIWMPAICPILNLHDVLQVWMLCIKIIYLSIAWAYCIKKGTCICVKLAFSILICMYWLHVSFYHYQSGNSRFQLTSEIIIWNTYLDFL